MNSQLEEHGDSRVIRVILAVTLMLIASLAVRWLTSASALPLTWDEKYTIPVIEHIVDEDWSFESVLDYDDTKGPTFFIAYAAAGEVLGVDPRALRWMSIALFVAGGGILVGCAAAAGISRRGCILTAALYTTLPYGMVLGQLVMSEAQFVAGSLLAGTIFAWSIGTPSGRRHEMAGVVMYGIAMAVLMHSRVHAVALGAAVCFAAIWVCGTGCLRWWAATIIAGLARLPLMFAWGGLVGPSFQDRYGLGFRLDSVTYLAAALVPSIGVFVLYGLLARDEHRRSRRHWMLGGGLVGVCLALFATPVFSSDPEDLRYAGLVATALRRFGDHPLALSGLMVAPCAVGVASLAVLAHEIWVRRHSRRFEDVFSGIAVWTLVVGWGLYALTRGDVYDRYLLAFSFALPMVMVLRMRPWLAGIQLLMQTVLALYQVVSDLGHA